MLCWRLPSFVFLCIWCTHTSHPKHFFLVRFSWYANKEVKKKYLKINKCTCFCLINFGFQNYVSEAIPTKPCWFLSSLPLFLTTQKYFWNLHFLVNGFFSLTCINLNNVDLKCLIFPNKHPGLRKASTASQQLTSRSRSAQRNY